MRYKNQKVFFNDNESYKRYLEKTRGLSQIKQFDTPVFRNPSVDEISNFKAISHVWTTGDRYFKLATEYYNDPTMWWVIAFYNQKPTEFHLRLGDIVYIPIPLETVLFYIGY